MAFKVSVDGIKCNGCEECLEACTVGMFQMKSGKAAPADEGECLGCETCIVVCDSQAITVTDTRVALSNTCQSLLSALDEMETETESRPTGGR
jgi:NAD-dependent dihydropyrimidine dehydrogenase PreA subunit